MLSRKTQNSNHVLGDVGKRRNGLRSGTHCLWGWMRRVLSTEVPLLKRGRWECSGSVYFLWYELYMLQLMLRRGGEESARGLLVHALGKVSGLVHHGAPSEGSVEGGNRLFRWRKCYACEQKGDIDDRKWKIRGRNPLSVGGISEFFSTRHLWLKRGRWVYSCNMCLTWVCYICENWCCRWAEKVGCWHGSALRGLFDESVMI